MFFFVNHNNPVQPEAPPHPSILTDSDLWGTLLSESMLVDEDEDEEEEGCWSAENRFKVLARPESWAVKHM